MHVGLNLVYLVPGETGGMETYARELIRSLLEREPELQLTAFVSRAAAADPSGPWNEVASVLVDVDARRRVEWVRGEQQLLPGLASRHGVDVLHSLASTAPLRGRFRRVVTVHDLIYRVYPEAHAGIRSKGMAILVPLAVRRSHGVIVPSRATQEDVTRFVGIAPERIDVIPEGVRVPEIDPAAEEDVRHRFDLGARPVVLTVSAKRPHKNLERLVEALALIPEGRRPILVLPGYLTSWEGDLRRQAESLGLAADTRFLGWVGAAELEALYALASACVFPSLYEGFGLPILEAMARGTPVACSDRASLPEVAGTAALLFDPESTRSIADAIELLLTDREAARRLAEAGRERVKAFTWDQTAERTVGVYRRVLGSREAIARNA